MNIFYLSVHLWSNFTHSNLYSVLAGFQTSVGTHIYWYWWTNVMYLVIQSYSVLDVFVLGDKRLSQRYGKVNSKFWDSWLLKMEKFRVQTIFDKILCSFFLTPGSH